MSAVLTPRQKEVAERVASGLGAKQIGRELNISPETVRDHVRNGAARLPGDGRPRLKLILFVLRQDDPSEE